MRIDGCYPCLMLKLVGLQTLMHQAVAGKMRYQEFHLVGEYSAAGQIYVFCMGWGKGHRDKLQSSLFRCAIALEVIAASAGRRHIHPVITTTTADRFDMVAGQVAGFESITAIQAKIGIAAEQGCIVKRWGIVRSSFMFRLLTPECADDGMHGYGTSAARPRVDTTPHPVKLVAHGIHHLVLTIQANGILHTDPFNGCGGDIGSQHTQFGVDHDRFSCLPGRIKL